MCVCLCLTALIKVLLSYEHQTLPANLHFKEPNPNNAGLKDGILKVVTEPTKFKGITALSNFGFGGGPLSIFGRIPHACILLHLGTSFFCYTVNSQPLW